MLAKLHFTKALGVDKPRCAGEGRFAEFAELIGAVTWSREERSPGIATVPIDELYYWTRITGRFRKLVGAERDSLLLYRTETRLLLLCAGLYFGCDLCLILGGLRLVVLLQGRDT